MEIKKIKLGKTGLWSLGNQDSNGLSADPAYFT